LLDALGGQGAVVVIEGRAGFGKSRLLAEALSRAEGEGIRTALGRADVDESVMPLAPLLSACFGGSSPLLDHADLSVLRSSGADRYWQLLELEKLLEHAAVEHPILICLDDLHWADAGTIVALRSLPARLSTVPIVWILAFRTGQASVSLLRAVTELEESKAKHLVLDPLDGEAIEQVVADLTRSRPAPSLLTITESAHGVPFFLVELVRGLLDEGLVQVEGGQAVLLQNRLPSRVRDSMRERLERVSMQARQAATAASVLGRSFRFDDLANMLATPPAALLGALEELTQAEILTDTGDRINFRHDIVRQAVLDSVPVAARRALDRQAAAILLAAGALPLEIASRIAAGAEPGDAVAIATLHEAAQALAMTDPGGASVFARKALALTTPTDPLRMSLVAESAVLLHAAGLGNEARDFANAALGQVLPPEAEAMVRLSIAQMYSLPADLRIDTGRHALALIGVSGPVRARHLAVMVLSLVAASRPAEARAAAASAQTAVDATHDRIAAMNLEFGRLALDEASFDYASMMTRIRTLHALGNETGEQAQVQAAEWFRANMLAGLGRLDEAMSVVSAGLDLAQRDHQAWIAPRWDIWRGWILLQRGQLADAGAVLEGAIASSSVDLALAIPDAAGLLALGQVALHTGDEHLTRRCTDIARATIAAEAYDDGRRQIAWLLALQALARGDAAKARDELRPAPEESPTVLLPVLARQIGAEPQLVRLALAARDPALADRAVQEAEERARLNPDIAAAVASAAHARGLRNEDLDELSTAVAQLDGQSRPLLLASALEDLGRAGVGRVRTSQGIDDLGRALELYQLSGAGWDARRVRGRLRALGVQRRSISPERPLNGWEALTDSELEVARLVATGLTNVRVAERLYVSPHTVSTHLRHIFAKLAVTSRVELTRIALRRN
jgi:DNA-binding CsgD family transcriptional regulator